MDAVGLKDFDAAKLAREAWENYRAGKTEVPCLSYGMKLSFRQLLQWQDEINRIIKEFELNGNDSGLRDHFGDFTMFPAKAKLNLGLRVFPARPDGFHDLETWMVPISWHDSLSVRTLHTSNDIGTGIQLEITGRTENIPTDPEKNLVGRAAGKLAQAAGIAVGVHITLHKVLPPGGGLGGGSSDAAATLVLLNKLWGLNWPEERLENLAAELGSDIPFFIRSTPRLCMGRGENMTNLPIQNGPMFAVLIIPPIPCPTKDVYAAFDTAIGSHAGIPPAANSWDWPTWSGLNAQALNEVLRNDLEEPAFTIAPALREIKSRTQQAAGQKIHLTGSGSTLFTLCNSSVKADQLTARLAAELGNTCTCLAAKLGDDHP